MGGSLAAHGVQRQVRGCACSCVCPSFLAPVCIFRLYSTLQSVPRQEEAKRFSIIFLSYLSYFYFPVLLSWHCCAIDVAQAACVIFPLLRCNTLAVLLFGRHGYRIDVQGAQDSVSGLEYGRILSQMRGGSAAYEHGNRVSTRVSSNDYVEHHPQLMKHEVT